MTLSLAGCRSTGSFVRNHHAPLPFEPATVHFQPAFTEMHDDPKNHRQPGHLEATVQLRDRFGDPVKALGEFRFELYRYRQSGPDPRGERFETAGLHIVLLTDLDENQKHWDRITQSYRFKLPLPPLPPAEKRIILQATFSPRPNYRMQDIITVRK